MTVEEALQILKQNGYKYTDKREELIRIFATEKRYMTAKEILEQMQHDFPSISFDTIYRDLALFEELEIVEATQLSDERIYRLACSPEKHHHHVICTACGRTERINQCPMNVLLGVPPNFVITGHKFEVYGYCTMCQEDNS